MEKLVAVRASFFFKASFQSPILFQTDKSGCATQAVKLGDFGLQKRRYEDTFTVSAELEETGPGRSPQGAVLRI